MRSIGSLLALALLCGFPAAAGPLEQVEGLTAAFNAHDIDAMTAFLAEDVEWLAISGHEITVEASGKSGLAQAMTDYFKNVPSARSEIEGSFVSGSYVVVRERALWKQQGQERSQSSLAVYQLADGLIKRVWYFPVEK